MAIKILKSETIKERKPNLRLRPNHYHYVPAPRRVYLSLNAGPAKRDGRGWYE